MAKWFPKARPGATSRPPTLLVNLSATGAHQARWLRITYGKRQESGNIDRAARPAFIHCFYGLKARHNPKVVRICSVDSLVQFKICRARCVGAWLGSQHLRSRNRKMEELQASLSYIVSLRTTLSQTKQILYILYIVLYAANVSMHIHMLCIKQMIQGEYEQVVLSRA